MPPLVALVLFGFVFIIALCLTVWAALTMGEQTRRHEQGTGRRDAGRAHVSYVSMKQPQPLVWRGTGLPRSTTSASVTQAASEDHAAKPSVSNDDYRGARAVVTPRQVTEDAFERFIENERNDRR